MAINKVVLHDESGTDRTLVDLTGDTVAPETLASGTTAHDKAGNPIVGTMQQSGDNAQSDWNENDETSPAFVKNRPMYSYISGTMIIPEQTIDFVNGEGFIVSNISKINEGDQILVTWDGQQYEETVFMLVAMKQVIIGNTAVIGLQPDTGEPFLGIFPQNPDGTMSIAFATKDKSAQHRIGVEIRTVKNHPIPLKYLPEPIFLNLKDMGISFSNLKNGVVSVSLGEENQKKFERILNEKNASNIYVVLDSWESSDDPGSFSPLVVPAQEIYVDTNNNLRICCEAQRKETLYTDQSYDVAITISKTIPTAELSVIAEFAARKPIKLIDFGITELKTGSYLVSEEQFYQAFQIAKQTAKKKGSVYIQDANGNFGIITSDLSNYSVYDFLINEENSLIVGRFTEPLGGMVDLSVSRIEGTPL